MSSTIWILALLRGDFYILKKAFLLGIYRPCVSKLSTQGLCLSNRYTTLSPHGKMKCEMAVHTTQWNATLVLKAQWSAYVTRRAPGRLCPALTRTARRMFLYCMCMYSGQRCLWTPSAMWYKDSRVPCSLQWYGAPTAHRDDSLNPTLPGQGKKWPRAFCFPFAQKSYKSDKLF